MKTETEFQIGRIYYRGNDIPQNDAEVVKWLQRAAEEGHDRAQDILGIMYKAGKGVTRNLILAYKWSNLAVAQGIEYNKEIKENLEKDMNQTQISQAQKL